MRSESSWIFPSGDPTHVSAFLANLNALVCDYQVRQKLGRADVRLHYLKQFPVLPPSAHGIADLDFICCRILRLTYTAWDLKPFAEDLGYNSHPSPGTRSGARCSEPSWTPTTPVPARP